MKKKLSPDYVIKVGALIEKHDLTSMDLVRMCDIGVTTAHQAVRGEIISLDTLYKIYNGLKRAGFAVNFADVVEIP